MNEATVEKGVAPEKIGKYWQEKVAIVHPELKEDVVNMLGEILGPLKEAKHAVREATVGRFIDKIRLGDRPRTSFGQEVISYRKGREVVLLSNFREPDIDQKRVLAHELLHPLFRELYEHKFFDRAKMQELSTKLDSARPEELTENVAAYRALLPAEKEGGSRDDLKLREAAIVDGINVNNQAALDSYEKKLRGKIHWEQVNEMFVDYVLSGGDMDKMFDLRMKAIPEDAKSDEFKALEQMSGSTRRLEGIRQYFYETGAFERQELAFQIFDGALSKEPGSEEALTPERLEQLLVQRADFQPQYDWEEEYMEMMYDSEQGQAVEPAEVMASRAMARTPEKLGKKSMLDHLKEIFGFKKPIDQQLAR